MAATIFVTGATGQTGGNVCEQLIERGDNVRALVRNPDEAAALSMIGVELIKGDISDADDVRRAAKGAEAAIHCAALLGGASQDPADFKAVNIIGNHQRARRGEGQRHAPGGGAEAAGINRECEIAGIGHRIQDLDYRSDPEALTAEFGPTLMAIAETAAKDVRTPRTADNLATRRLGYHPISFDDGLRLLIQWLRELGRLE
jgi:nucleoside-diphosphate-sugar epimerase